VAEKVPYLKELGVTVVELLPVHQFDPAEGNYWGYMTLNFFSPHQAYAVDPKRDRDEFRAMVKALHEADIHVILDVVYNHTAEEDQNGPTYSFKGIDNASYYLLSCDPNAPYHDFSGTGNSLNAANPYVRTMILDSLRWWVTQMHVDGFRFDLASVLTRDEDGHVYGTDVPLLTAIRSDPLLRNVHLIAEPWDAAGAYQLGTGFPGELWHQWNGQFRDDVRRFLRGDEGTVPALMYRLYGSDDLFPDTLRDARRPFQSINFVTCHDGFTLYDLVSHNEKHNLANGNDNRDGTDANFSWNCGWEGDEGVPDDVMALRKRQVKNFACVLLLSNGVPMLAAGDEFLQTQGGNNNPYNQDNETAWLNWDRLEKFPDVFRFFRLMIAFRKAHPTLGRSRFWRDDVTWHGVGPEPDLAHQSHSIAFALRGGSVGDRDLYVMINAWTEPLDFQICEGQPGDWRRVVDTRLESPDDISEPGREPVVPGMTYRVEARSVVVLIGPADAEKST
jgi:glycogen operon protein